MASERYSRHLIRTARRITGLTQAELARRAATSQSAISAYEGGRRSPSVETLCRILEVTGFELRMRLATPDTHERALAQASSLLPREQLEAFQAKERGRVEGTLAPRNA